ncbi:MAG TPA: hypothetical protein VGR27_00715, partial [Longimicrobiaceae bacterium]|nr:hypothetical protein [Longimicrobiaceae bacterium]
LGFPLPAPMREEIERLDLLSLEGRIAERVLLIESASPPELKPLLDQLSRSAGEVEHLHVPERRVWLAEPFRGIVPHQLLEALVAWMDRVHE